MLRANAKSVLTHQQRYCMHILEPGKAYEEKLSLKLESAQLGDAFTFAMDFIPD